MLQIRCHDCPRHLRRLSRGLGNSGGLETAEKKAISFCPDMDEGFVGNCFFHISRQVTQHLPVLLVTWCGLWSVMWAGSVSTKMCYT